MARTGPHITPAARLPTVRTVFSLSLIYFLGPSPCTAHFSQILSLPSLKVFFLLPIFAHGEQEGLYFLAKRWNFSLFLMVQDKFVDAAVLLSFFWITDYCTLQMLSLMTRMINHWLVWYMGGYHTWFRYLYGCAPHFISCLLLLALPCSGGQKELSNHNLAWDPLIKLWNSEPDLEVMFCEELSTVTHWKIFRQAGFLALFFEHNISWLISLFSELCNFYFTVSLFFF